MLSLNHFIFKQWLGNGANALYAFPVLQPPRPLHGINVIHFVVSEGATVVYTTLGAERNEI